MPTSFWALLAAASRWKNAAGLLAMFLDNSVPEGRAIQAYHADTAAYIGNFATTQGSGTNSLEVVPSVG